MRLMMGPPCTMILVSNSKSDVLAASKVNVELCGRLEFTPYVGGRKIVTSPIIAALCNNIDAARNNIQQRLQEVYTAIVQTMAADYDFYSVLHAFVAKMDLIQSYARCAVAYNYCRPRVLPNDQADPSFIDIQGLRHPIVERIIDTPYVPNDICLSQRDRVLRDQDMSDQGTTERGTTERGTTDSHCGMLLTAANGAGKSVLMKAAGICIILAQIGMYVPAAAMTYRCYTSIITRLTSDDDLFTGRSSYYIEISELRTVLRASNAQTLVLADELCKGTAPQTATAITAATILDLAERNTSFIITTHIREILDIPAVATCNKLQVVHLTFDYDADKKVMVYGRKLQPGLCAPEYGLLVAQSQGLPSKFIVSATQLYYGLQQESAVVANKRSNYNSEVIVDTCARCGSRTNLHTHHLQEQHTAQNGYVDHVPVHSRGNLTVLCATCHQQVHSTQEVLQLVDTTAGTQLRTAI